MIITDNDYLEAAHRLWHTDGEIEIETANPVVSRGGDESDEGAYVKAWVWVDKDAIK